MKFWARKIVPLLLGIWVAVYALPSAAEPKLTLSQYPKVYRDSGIIRVTFVSITAAKKQALIEVIGTGTPLDGKVFRYDEKNQGHVDTYVMQYDGSEATRLLVEPGYWSKGVGLLIPDREETMPLYFDEKLSRRARVSRIAERYEKDKELQARLAKFDRTRREAQLGKEVAEAVLVFSKNCGSQIKVVIDWKSFSDELLRKATMASFCGRPIERLAVQCGTSENNRKTIEGKIETIRCAYGPQFKIDLTGKVIDLSVDPLVPIQENSITEFLRAQF